MSRFVVVRLPDAGAGAPCVTADALPEYRPDSVLDRRIVETGSGGVLALVEEAEVRATGTLTLQRLDTEVYRQPMGKMVVDSRVGSASLAPGAGALVSALVTQARSGGLAHLACHLPVEAVTARHALERDGFLLMDSSVQYRWAPLELVIQEHALLWRVQRPGGDLLRIPKFGVTFRSAEPRDVVPLRRLARATFTTDARSRYVNDPRLDIEATGELYARWVSNAIEGTFGDFTPVAVGNDEVIGFQIFRLDPDDPTRGSMGIGAVRPEWRGRGVFGGLLAAILRWCADRGVTTAFGRTLVQNWSMHPSCRAFCGAEVAVIHGFHCWLDECADARAAPRRS